VLRATYSLLAAVLVIPVALAASPYVGQTSRSIKALSDEEVADYLSGKGMGLAKAAELNGYPGPAHVLELATQLELSPAQRVNTEAIFERMQTSARAAGRRLVDEERRLDELFVSKAISPTLLHQTLDSIASLQSAVREIHLRAHLEQAEVLSAAQAMKYWHLRGYADDNPVHHHAH
jgi:hypothetical protein